MRPSQISALLLLPLAAASWAAEPKAERLCLAAFESDGLPDWSAEPRSRLERVERDGRRSLKWTFASDGKTRYGNLIVKRLAGIDLSDYDQVELWFRSAGPVKGRVGFQLLTPDGVLGLTDVHLQAKQGEWRRVRLDLEPHRRQNVVALRLFCDGVQWGAGEFVFFLRDIHAIRFPGVPVLVRRDYGEPLGQRFSALPAERQAARRRAAEPVPLPERRAPYSTPMYYLMHKGRGFGPRDADSPRLDRPRADWQEAMIRDWAELGLTSLHLYLYTYRGRPGPRVSHRDAWLTVKRLCAKYGLGLGVRLDLPSAGKTTGWGLHPLNPDRDLESCLAWVREVAATFRGAARYYIIGDELNFGRVAPEKGGWTAELYMPVWAEVAKAIRAVDADARLSMFGASGGCWNDVRAMLSMDQYRKLAGAVAMNAPDYRTVSWHAAELDRLAPNLKLLSNGVGYVSSGDAQPRHPQQDKYRRYSDRDQGAVVAKTMFAWWEVGADAAPYYITLRNWVIRGKTYPHWYGFFGIEDYVIDDDRLTVKRYPAWYAFQTITHTFHDRPSFTAPGFSVTPSLEISKLSAFVRDDRELVLALWQDFHKTAFIDVRIESSRFQHAVRVDLFDKDGWQDEAYTVGRDGSVTLRDVRVSFEPAIIRLFAD